MRIQLSIKPIIFVTAVILITCVSGANAKQYSYLGVDFSYVQAEFKQNFGKNIFSNKPMPQFNIFLGHHIFPLLGFEAGYSQTLTIKSCVFVPAMTSQFGLEVFTGFASNMYVTNKALQGFNVNYVPQIKLNKVIDLIPVIGLAYIKIKANLNLDQFDGSTASSVQQDDYALSFAVAKLMPRLGLRLQVMFYNVGIRASYIWEQTSLLQPQAIRNINPRQFLVAKLENASTLGLGIFYQF